MRLRDTNLRRLADRAKKHSNDAQIVADLITGKKKNNTQREELLLYFDRLSEEYQLAILKAAQERVFTVKAACVS